MAAKNGFEKSYLLIINTITMICIILGCFIHVGGWIIGGHKGSVLVSGQSTGEGAGSGTAWSADEISAVTANIDQGELEVKEGDAYSVEYRGYPDGKEPVVSVEGGTLTIVQQNGRGMFNNGISGDCEVVLHIPDGDRPAANLTLSMGSLDISDLELGDVTIESSMGAVNMKDCETQILNISADMGEINVKDTEFTSGSFTDDMGSIVLKDVDFESADCEADMGSIEVSGDFSQLTAECSMGSIKVEADDDDASVSLSADMGEVSFNGQDCGRNFTK